MNKDALGSLSHLCSKTQITLFQAGPEDAMKLWNIYNLIPSSQLLSCTDIQHYPVNYYSHTYVHLI